MAQPPTLVDQLQIEPGEAGTRLLDRDTTDGGLRFTDPNVVASLLQLVGLRNLTGLFIVGDGDGAQYTTIQAAIDAVPDTSSPSDPSVILVGPGEYGEKLTITKDGITIIGQGRPKISAATGPTVAIADDPVTTPENVLLLNLVLEQTGAGEDVLSILGAGTYASGTVTIDAIPLTAGDLITIGGTNLTGIVGTRTSGSDDFSIDGATAAAIAVEIAAAINDPLNSFAATVEAVANSNVVTITAVTPGAGGNAITLSVTAANLTASGATLTGGGSAGSPVASGAVTLIDCDLLSVGAGGRQLNADTVNHIRIVGGTWRGSAANSLARVNQCASFRLSNVEWVNDLEFAYDTGNDQPSDPTSEYRVGFVGQVGDVVSNQVGEGSLAIADCPSVGDVVAGGDQTLAVVHSRLGTLTLSDTLVTTLVESTRGTGSVAGGTPTLAESMWTTAVPFAASALELVAFEVPAPDTTYAVLVDCPDLTAVPQATVKTVAGFTLSTGGVPITGTVYATVVRQM